MPKNSGPKAKKAAKKSTPKKQVAAPAPEPVPEPVVVAPVTVTPSATEVETVSLEDQFKDILTRLQEFRTLSNTLMADVRKLQKNVAKQVRESNKKNRKRKVRSGDSKRPPSGFAKPALISDALCQFLGVSKGSEMARTEVTKYLTKYIKEHKLQDEKNRRIIICDSKLTALLKVQPNDEVTYFNLQRYMKPHFPKSASSSA